MRSGGPWNLRGLRPETREAARDAARRSGMSVGEWLNNVIRQDGEQDDAEYGEPMRDDDEDWRGDKHHEQRYENRRVRRRIRHAETSRCSAAAPALRMKINEPTSRRRQAEREAENERKAALARQEFGEVHARLDRLTQQLDRMAHSDGGLAASKGDSDAAKKRDEVGAHLDAQALAAVKLAVQKWSAELQPEDAVNVKAPPGGWDAPEHAEKSKPRPRAGKPLALESKLN